MPLAHEEMLDDTETRFPIPRYNDIGLRSNASFRRSMNAPGRLEPSKKSNVE